MEAWATIVILVLSNLFTFGSTYFITKIQLNHSDRESQKQYDRAVEQDRRQRQREAKTQSLFKLKDELARVTAKQIGVIVIAGGLHPTGNIEDDRQVTAALQETVANLSNYVKGGELLHAMYSLDDMELFNKVKEIIDDWGRSKFTMPPFQIVGPEQMQEAEKLITTTENKVIEVQSLITKKLTEL